MRLNNSMANGLTKFLGSIGNGILGGNGDMRDHAHAARLFTDDFMALAPKVEFLYHVFFDINPVAVRSPGNFGWSKTEPRIEAGMLVKQCQVPGVQINTETKNQYGKKTNIQTQVQYQPVQITFHDDHSNLISGMWQQYFKNYYADSNYPDELAQQPTYSAVDNVCRPNQANKMSAYQFGYHSWISVQFFNRISIYQLSQHRFYEYTLINPMISSWQGPNLNSASSQPTENTMQIIYEGIKYAEGRVEVGKPDGFAQLHYDTTPSPLSLLGGGTASLFGNTGVIAGGLDVFGDIASGDFTSSPGAFLGTLIKGANVLKNADRLTKEGVRNEAFQIGQKAVTQTINQQIRIPASDQQKGSLTTPTLSWQDVKEFGRVIINPKNDKLVTTRIDETSYSYNENDGTNAGERK